MRTGFTLIEISIVLVIIGLIVGGILTGSDLIKQSQIRATISQIASYNSAAYTFKTKYSNYLPGDIPEPAASGFGFSARGTDKGEGDGDGFLSGTSTATADNNWGSVQATGETPMFWADLSRAGLIPETFSTAQPNVKPTSTITTAQIANYLPKAKMGGNNYVYVYSLQVPSSAVAGGFISSPILKNVNYFGFSVISEISQWGVTTANAGLTVTEAYNIDQKYDDGLPASGSINAIALLNNSSPPDGLIWAGTSYGQGMSAFPAIAASSTTCFDNNNVNWANVYYSLRIDNGNNVNCALSVAMK